MGTITVFRGYGGGGSTALPPTDWYILRAFICCDNCCCALIPFAGITGDVPRVGFGVMAAGRVVAGDRRL